MHKKVMGRMAMLSLPSASVTTTGRLTTASRSRIATCGWLMIGVASTAPYAPGFVIVKVPPLSSSGERRLPRARSARSLIRPAIPVPVPRTASVAARGGALLGLGIVALLGDGTGFDRRQHGAHVDRLA